MRRFPGEINGKKSSVKWAEPRAEDENLPEEPEPHFGDFSYTEPYRC